MNTVAARNFWPLAVSFVVTIALVCMMVAAVWHTRIGQLPWLTAAIVAGFAASIAGTIGGLILANVRRNVMWILAVALSTTALMALLATVLSSLGPG